MLRNALLTAVGLVLIGLARLGFNTVALNAFGEELAGRLNVALSLGVLLSLPASTALGATTVRYMAQARGQGRGDTLSWLYRLTLGATVVIAGASALLAARFGPALSASQGIDAGLVHQAIVVASVYVAYLFFRNVLYALDRVQLYAKLEVLSGAVFFTTLALLAVLGHGHWLLAAFVLGQTVFSLAVIYNTRAELARPASAGAHLPLGPLAAYSLISFAGTAASLSVRELAVFFAPSAEDLAGAAHLALAMSILTPLQFLPRMFRTVLFAHSAELEGRGRRHELGRSVGAASHWLLFATLPACTLLALAAEPIIVLFGGTPTPERLLVFRLLTAAALVDVVSTPAANALPGVGAVKPPSWGAIVALGLALAVWAVLTPSLGLTALALGMLVSSVVKGGVPIVAAWRLLRAPLTLTPGAALALGAMAAGSLVLLSFWGPLTVAGIYALASAPVLARPLKEMSRELVTRFRASRAGSTPRAVTPRR